MEVSRNLNKTNVATPSHLIGEGNKPVQSDAKYTEILQASNEKLLVCCSVSKFLHWSVKNWNLEGKQINLKFGSPFLSSHLAHTTPISVVERPGSGIT